jgi:hypothetical protein
MSQPVMEKWNLFDFDLACPRRPMISEPFFTLVPTVEDLYSIQKVPECLSLCWNWGFPLLLPPPP